MWSKVTKHQEIIASDYHNLFEGGKVNVIHLAALTGNPKHAIPECVSDSTPIDRHMHAGRLSQ